MIVVRANQSQQDTSAAVAPKADVQVVAAVPPWQTQCIYIYIYIYIHTYIHGVQSTQLSTASAAGSELPVSAADTTSAGNGAAPVPPRSAQASYRHLQLDGGKPWWMINATISTCPPPQPGDQLKNHGHHPDSNKFWSIEAYNIIYINSPCDQCQRPHPWAKTASPEATKKHISGTLQMIASILLEGIQRLRGDGDSFWLFPNLHKPYNAAQEELKIYYMDSSSPPVMHQVV